MNKFESLDAQDMTSELAKVSYEEQENLRSKAMPAYTPEDLKHGQAKHGQ